MLRNWGYWWSLLAPARLAMRRQVGSRCLHDERGATTAEYALLLALVVVILISTLSQLGAELNTKLLEIIDQLKEA